MYPFMNLHICIRFKARDEFYSSMLRLADLPNGVVYSLTYL